MHASRHAINAIDHLIDQIDTPIHFIRWILDALTLAKGRVNHGRQPRLVQLVFDAMHFLQSEEPLQPGVPLPHGWDVTSDSIAARIAQVIGAVELVLLKQKPSSSPAEAMRDGLVDDYFEMAAAGIDQLRIESIAPSRTSC